MGTFTLLFLILSFSGVKICIPTEEKLLPPQLINISTGFFSLDPSQGPRWNSLSPEWQLLWHSFQKRKRAESCRAHSPHSLIPQSVDGRWQDPPRFTMRLDFAFLSLLNGCSFHISLETYELDGILPFFHILRMAPFSWNFRIWSLNVIVFWIIHMASSVMPSQFTGPTYRIYISYILYVDVGIFVLLFLIMTVYLNIYSFPFSFIAHILYRF